MTDFRALAQPEPQGPSDEDLIQLAIDTRLYRFQATAGDPIQYEMTEQQIHAFARAVLARFGRPDIEPVPQQQQQQSSDDEISKPSKSDLADYNERATARFQQMDDLERYINFDQDGWNQTDAGIEWQRLMNEQGADENSMGL